MHNFADFVKDTEPTRARQLWEHAANEGFAPSMANLAYLLEAEDRDASRRWYERAAAGGHVESLYRLGLTDARLKLGGGREYIEAAAARGHTGAMRYLGTSAMRTDDDEALRWLQRAVELGDEHAVFPLRVLQFLHRPGFVAAACRVGYRAFLNMMHGILRFKL
jgi:TPR repeat protein